MINIICALDINNGFGKNGTIPWKCTEDLKHFAKTTKHHILIMGYNTWMSIPQEKITRDRICIIVTKNELLNSFKASSLNNAIEMAKNIDHTKEIFVIGGVNLISEAINVTDKCIISRINGSYECDIHLNIDFNSSFELYNSKQYDDFVLETWIKQP